MIETTYTWRLVCKGSLLSMVVYSQRLAMECQWLQTWGLICLFYFAALKILCEPLSKLIISECENILCGLEHNSYPMKLPNIEDAFHQFIIVYSAFDKDGDAYNNPTVLSLATAAFTLSFATKKKTKACTKFLRDLISTDCLQANSLIYVYASFYWVMGCTR
ncbi:separase [Artemisia annua]|uniref:Separase n=1 Tax=Artemisia annua TaxID=35608 RepID=A0A2U1KGP0_ARTAN|nr:separase [Artemisia annua]